MKKLIGILAFVAVFAVGTSIIDFGTERLWQEDSFASQRIADTSFRIKKPEKEADAVLPMPKDAKSLQELQIKKGDLIEMDGYLGGEGLYAVVSVGDNNLRLSKYIWGGASDYSWHTIRERIKNIYRSGTDEYKEKAAEFLAR